MFTGIIVSTGRVTSLAEKSGDLELAIDAAALDLGRIAVGDSISVQGACLTVTRMEGTSFQPMSIRSRRNSIIDSQTCK